MSNENYDKYPVHANLGHATGHLINAGLKTASFGKYGGLETTESYRE